MRIEMQTDFDANYEGRDLSKDNNSCSKAGTNVCHLSEESFRERLDCESKAIVNYTEQPKMIANENAF